MIRNVITFVLPIIVFLNININNYSLCLASNSEAFLVREDGKKQGLAVHETECTAPACSLTEHDSNADNPENLSNHNATSFALFPEIANFKLPPEIAKAAQSYLKDFPVRNVKKYMELYGTPRRLPPFVWCSRQVLVVAVPSRSTNVGDGEGREYPGGWNEFEEENDKDATARAEECSTAFVPDFFHHPEHQADAWLGRWTGGCGGMEVETEVYSYRRNTFRPPGTGNNVVVTCACPLEDPTAPCEPSAQWEAITKSRDIWIQKKSSKDVSTVAAAEHVFKQLNGEAQAFFRGGVLSANIVVGGDTEVTVTPSRENRLLLESRASSVSGVLWPISCQATCETEDRKSSDFRLEDCLQPLILGGCPVSNRLDFRVELMQRGNSRTGKPAITVFSVLPFAFERDISMLGRPGKIKLQCEVKTFNKRPSISDFCGQELQVTTEVIAVTPLDGIRGASQKPTSKDRRLHRRRRIEFLDKKDRSDSKPPHRRTPQQRRADAAETLEETQVLPKRRLASSAQRMASSSFDSIGKGSKGRPSWSSDFSKHMQQQRTKRNEVTDILNGIDNVERGIPVGTSGTSIQDIIGGQAAEKNSEGIMHNTPKGRWFGEVANKVLYDNWAVDWTRFAEHRETQVRVGNDFGFFGAGVGLEDGMTQVNTGWRDVLFSSFTSEANEEVAVSFIKGNYGVSVDRSNLERASAVEVLARGVETATLVNLLDRDYGQRVKVRQFELMARHDFDEYILQDPNELATEIFFSYRALGISVVSDMMDTEYGVSVGYRGYQVSVLRDFDDRVRDVQANWGNGWQFSMSNDFADAYSDEIFTRIGFGKLGRAYVAAGAGVGEDGLPQGSVELQLSDLGFGVDFVEDAGDNLFVYALTVGRFTYVWESEVLPENMNIPLLFGGVGQQALSGAGNLLGLLK